MGRKNSYLTFGFFLAAAAILGSCTGGDRTESTFIVDPGHTDSAGNWGTNFVRDYAYVEGRIFDLAYPGEIGPYDSVAVIVFEEETRIDNPDAIEVYFQTGPLDPTGIYDARQVRMKDITGDGEFELLYGQDTTRCPAAIVFYTSRRRALGVFMRIGRFDASGVLTGIDTIGHWSAGQETDTVRVLRPLQRDLLPSNPAWSLMWRNCYRIPQHVAIEDLDVTIFKGLSGTEGSDSCFDYQIVNNVAGDPYIEILGLDQWDNNSLDRKVPDGKIDPLMEVFRPEWGLIIFPHREPFSTDTTFVNGNNERTDTLLETAPSLYNYISRSERISVSYYYLQVRAWTPDFIYR